jgi:hypothetical protein
MAGERSRNDGCSGEQGLIVINVRMESSIADGMGLNPGAEVILDENWDTIVRVARLLIEKGILSKSELEGEVTLVDMAPLHGPNGHLNGVLHIAQASERIAAFLTG